MKQLHILIVTASLVLCLILAASPARAQEEEFEPTKADVYREQGVTIVLPEQWEPFSFVDEQGNRAGYLVEVWQAWAKHNGIDVRYEYRDAPGALESMASNATDIHGGFHFDGQDEVLDLADAVHSQTSLLVIREDGEFDCGNVMSGGSVGMADYANAIQMAEAMYPGVKFVVYSDAKTAIMALVNGEVDGLSVGYPSLAQLDEEIPILDKLDICRTLFFHEVYVGVQKGQIELLELVNDGMNAIPAEEMQQITERWFLTAERPKLDWKEAVRPAAIAFLIIVGIVVLWLRKRG